MRFNKNKAKKYLINGIYKWYVNRRGLFEYIHHENGDAPQNIHIPKGIEKVPQLLLFGNTGSKLKPKAVKKGSYRHQLFLYFTTIITYRSNSYDSFERSVKIFNEHPYLFDKNILSIDLDEIKDIFDKFGLVHPNAMAERWKRCGVDLFKLYNGKPLDIFKGREIDEIIKAKKSNGKMLFGGLGPKLFSLMALFYEELGLIDPVKRSFPSDNHIQNQCISLGIVEVEIKNNLNAALIAELIRKNVTEILDKHNLNSLYLSHAQWFLGNALCVYCKNKRGQVDVLCPVSKYCLGRIPTEAYRLRSKWDLKKEHPLFDKEII